MKVNNITKTKKQRKKLETRKAIYFYWVEKQIKMKVNNNHQDEETKESWRRAKRSIFFLFKRRIKCGNIADSIE